MATGESGFDDVPFDFTSMQDAATCYEVREQSAMSGAAGVPAGS